MIRSGHFYRDMFKPNADRVAAALMFVLLSPFLAVAAIAIRVDSAGPVFFRQERVGQRQRLFKIIKFRTMTVDPERVITQTRADSDGVTRVGRLFRRTKIDELPQLINVMRGEMSFVGPRPCLPRLVPELDARELRRFEAKPGLTGLAQTSGAVELTWHERCAHDVSYVDRVSLAMDVSLVAKTGLVILLGDKRFVKRADEHRH